MAGKGNREQSIAVHINGIGLFDQQMVETAKRLILDQLRILAKTYGRPTRNQLARALGLERNRLPRIAKKLEIIDTINNICK